MADGKDKKKTSDVLKSLGFTLYFLLSIILLAAYLIFLKTDRVLYLGGKIFSVKLLLYFWFTINSIDLLNRGLKAKTSGGKKNYIASGVCIIMLAGGIIACGSSAYNGFAHSKNSQKIKLSDGNVICLQEYGSKSKRRDTQIYIYQTKKFTAVKTGKIDESYISTDCLAQNAYSYDYDDTSKTLIIHCNYGTFGNQFLMLRPEYETGTVDYKFQLK